MKEKPPLPKLPDFNVGFYRHTTSGKLVRVLFLAWDEETLDTSAPRARVVYHDWDPISTVRFGRRLEIFTGEVEFEGRMVKRFEYIGPA